MITTKDVLITLLSIIYILQLIVIYKQKRKINQLEKEISHYWKDRFLHGDHGISPTYRTSPYSTASYSPSPSPSPSVKDDIQ